MPKEKIMISDYKKPMYQLPEADFLCRKSQTSAYLRSYTVTWEPPADGFFYLEYSYSRTHWYRLNGGCRIEASALPGEVLSHKEELVSPRHPVITLPLSIIRTLQARYGAPEPIVLASREDIDLPGDSGRLPEKITVTYTNGMTEERPLIWKPDETWEAGKGSKKNPRMTGFIQTPDCAAPLASHRADPYIYKHTDGKYYFIGSHTDAGHNLDGRYQYLYLILRCADTLEGLTDNSGQYTEKIIYEKAPLEGADGFLKSPHLWAPEIHFINGGWYVYYTASISDTSSWRIRPHCLACTGPDPMKDNWVEKGPVRTTVEGDIAFTDFSLDHTYLRHNGQDYFLWAQKTDNISDIFISRLENPWTICTPAVKITRPEYSWELHGFPVNEGPAVLKHGGKIFVTFSASGTDAMYCMGLLYADETADLLDAVSWTKCPYPVFQSSPATGYYGPGHNSFTRSDDDSEDLIIYHCRQEERYLGEDDYQPLYDAGRNAYIGKVFWNPDGMPSFSVPGASIAARAEDLKVR